MPESMLPSSKQIGVGTMTYRNEHTGHRPAYAGYGNTPARVPFVELVEPLMYVGEELVRYATVVARVAYRLAGAFNRWRNERATFNALSALDDHRLDDIGVRRDEIAALARKLANG
jgi:uncharacterized protein YjiS (DUF1127 family)